VHAWHRRCPLFREFGGESNREVGVAGDERAPGAVGGDTGDPITDLVIGDSRPHIGDHAGEIGTELRKSSLEARVATVRNENVSEVDTGCLDGHLDLPGPR
jgi:hypothetical protein